jgi:hypothetical protein
MKAKKNIFGSKLLPWRFFFSKPGYRNNYKYWHSSKEKYGFLKSDRAVLKMSAFCRVLFGPNAKTIT